MNICADTKQRLIVLKGDELYIATNTAFMCRRDNSLCAKVRCSDDYVYVLELVRNSSYRVEYPGHWTKERLHAELDAATNDSPLADLIYKADGHHKAANQIYDMLVQLGGFELLNEFNELIEK